MFSPSCGLLELHGVELRPGHVFELNARTAHPLTPTMCYAGPFRAGFPQLLGRGSDPYYREVERDASEVDPPSGPAGSQARSPGPVNLVSRAVPIEL